ncbi:putative AlkP superfamily pyrophosphatase or phosphodiesterase [Solirubrobacter pauli]|uniref:Putative AlkP superfamily pyrophosphatase or phosphodiesterase n=1 Tax=Solirubrobacter pauli TaxID=166793 RepID=A0A660LBM2_9ACTN|nr:alkaline phosphatase family protein [Solirubrobacter pauli]RKQ92457.1 putative AlkP superfamily pyrophosphatase or phosphodiesterase [Solirubrobacter pauli]
MPKKLVLAVIDAMKPAMLERAIATGRAPTLQLLIERGQYTDECVAAFPSVTPVCAASIATGTGPSEHEIPAMNWWHRGEDRYVEYGTSFGASRAFGIRQSLTDTIYNMNLEHLSRDVKTVFEHLDDADIRTAGTTYLMYRGRHRHEPSVSTALSRLAHTAFGLPTWGPKELFYADMFASRKTSCRSQLGLPGVRDQHSGCVSEFMVQQDLFDFLLLSLPDNDTHSHKYGPFAQVDSIAAADKQIARVMDAAGGPDRFLEDHAVIVCSDHSQSKVEGEIDLFRAFDGFGLRAAQRPREDDEIAVCPNSRAAQVYVLDRDRRRQLIPRIERTLLALEGVDLTMRMGDHPDGEAIVRGERSRGVKELRFAPRGELSDARGERWSVEGDLDLLGLKVEDDQIRSATYPDALSRVWSALRCHTTGEVLASARPGYEFLDWGGAHHVGGGSHGSLHANDSNAVLIWTGTGPEKASKEQWALRDITPMALQHFGVSAG